MAEGATVEATHRALPRIVAANRVAGARAHGPHAYDHRYRIVDRLAQVILVKPKLKCASFVVFFFLF